VGPGEPAVGQSSEELEDLGAGGPEPSRREEVGPSERYACERLADVIDHLYTGDRHLGIADRDGLAGHRRPPITPL
jgi:hypothetical protein